MPTYNKFQKHEILRFLPVSIFPKDVYIYISLFLPRSSYVYNYHLKVFFSMLMNIFLPE